VKAFSQPLTETEKEERIQNERNKENRQKSTKPTKPTKANPQTNPNVYIPSQKMKFSELNSILKM